MLFVATQNFVHVIMPVQIFGRHDHKTVYCLLSMQRILIQIALVFQHIWKSFLWFCTYLSAGSSLCTLTASLYIQASQELLEKPDAQSHFHKLHYTARASVTMTDSAVNSLHKGSFRQHSWIYYSIHIYILWKALAIPRPSYLQCY